MRAWLVVALLVCGLAAPAEAQPSAAGPVVFGGGGGSRMGADEGSLGSGAAFQGGIGYEFRRTVSLEVAVGHGSYSRNIAGGPLEGSTTIVFVDARRYFGQTRTQPFLMGTAGFMHIDQTHTYPGASGLITVDETLTESAWGGGAGVRFRVGERAFVRPQYRLVFSSSTGVSGLQVITVDVGYRW
jgi:hypothetical protein